MFSRNAPFVGLACGFLIGLGCGGHPTDPPIEDSVLETSRELPFVEAFEPTSAMQGSRVALRVLGENFDPGSRVDLLLSGNTVNEVQTLSTQFVTAKELVANISIGNDAPVGAYEVQVTTSKGKRGIPIEDFDIVANAGSLEVTVATSGEPEDLDPNGYTLTVGGSSRLVAVNETVTFEPLAVGSHIVRIDGVAENCAVAGANPRTVRVVGEDDIQFTVACLRRLTKEETSFTIAFQDSPAFPSDIYLKASGTPPVNVTNHPATDMMPALSPDRSRIVFASNRGGPRESSFDLYVVGADGGGLVRLTDTPGFDLVGSQAWSPDGSRIAFTYSDSSGADIYLMNADGSGVVRLTEDGSIGCPPAWSPDGAGIAFCKDGGIYRMAPIPGSSMIRVVSDGFDPSWSPDGSRIAYSVGGAWDWPLADLAVVGIDGTGFTQLYPNWDNNEIALYPSWSPDGSRIAFARSRGGSFDIVIVPFLGDGFGEVIRITPGLHPSWK